jgi:hypothetical protein
MLVAEIPREESMASLRARSLLGLAFAASLALASPAPAAEEAAPEKAWDQAAVTALAGQLAKACVDLYDEYYKTPGSSGGAVGTGQAKDSYRLKHIFRRLEEQTQQLAGALAAGKGRDETTPAVEDIGMMARDARVRLQRMFVQSPLQARIDAARGLWRQLLPYYGIAPPAEP